MFLLGCQSRSYHRLEASEHSSKYEKGATAIGCGGYLVVKAVQEETTEPVGWDPFSFQGPEALTQTSNKKLHVRSRYQSLDQQAHMLGSARLLHGFAFCLQLAPLLRLAVGSLAVLCLLLALLKPCLPAFAKQSCCYCESYLVATAGAAAVAAAARAAYVGTIIIRDFACRLACGLLGWRGFACDLAGNGILLLLSSGLHRRGFLVRVCSLLRSLLLLRLPIPVNLGIAHVESRGRENSVVFSQRASGTHFLHLKADCE